jgi:hypothetical protein
LPDAARRTCAANRCISGFAGKADKASLRSLLIERRLLDVASFVASKPEPNRPYGGGFDEVGILLLEVVFVEAECSKDAAVGGCPSGKTASSHSDISPSAPRIGQALFEADDDEIGTAM